MQAFEEASGKKCRYKVAPRRGGDATAVWAATETAEKVSACRTWPLERHAATAECCAEFLVQQVTCCNMLFCRV